MSSKLIILSFLIFCGILDFKTQTSAVAVEETCGKIPVGRENIIGEKRGAFPWVAVLMNNQGTALCGGTLLTKNKVLTAAHCIRGKDDAYNFTSDDLIVTLGAHNLGVSFERGRMSVGIESIEVHKDWNTQIQSFDADIAMLTLSDDATFSRYIQPICLVNPGSEIARISKGYSVSYGNTGYDEMHKKISKPIEIPIQNSNQECFSTNEYLGQLSSSRTFCGGSRNGSGVCFGDGGNGFVVKHQDTYYLRGIVSASLAASDGCDLHNYAIFTNVPNFYDWISERIDCADCTTKVEYITSAPRTRVRTTAGRSFWRFGVQNTTTEWKITTTTRPTSPTAWTTQQTLETRNERYESEAKNDCSKWYKFCDFGL